MTKARKTSPPLHYDSCGGFLFVDAHCAQKLLLCDPRSIEVLLVLLEIQVDHTSLTINLHREEQALFSPTVSPCADYATLAFE